MADFCLNKKCPKLLCGLDIGHRRRQIIPMWTSSGERNASGSQCMSNVCDIEHYVMTSLGRHMYIVTQFDNTRLTEGRTITGRRRRRPGSFQTVSRGHILVFFNRHCSTMNLVKEKQGGPVPPDLKRWPFKLIRHFVDTTRVSPSPAGTAGCCPLTLISQSD